MFLEDVSALKWHSQIKDSGIKQQNWVEDEILKRFPVRPPQGKLRPPKPSMGTPWIQPGSGLWSWAHLCELLDSALKFAFHQEFSQKSETKHCCLASAPPPSATGW